MKQSGPRTELCGTEYRASAQSDASPNRTTLWSDNRLAIRPWGTSPFFFYNKI